MCEVESSGEFPIDTGCPEEGRDGHHVRISRVSDEVMDRMPHIEYTKYFWENLFNWLTRGYLINIRDFYYSDDKNP